MRCCKCGRELPPDSRFCQYCGEDLSRMRFCPSCGFQLRDGMNFCSRCGRDLRTAAPAQPGGSQDAVPLPEEAAIPAWSETAAPPEAAPAESRETPQGAEFFGGWPGNARDSVPVRTVENAREEISGACEAPPAERELAGEDPVPVSGDETEETSAAGGGPRRQKKPKWILPAVLCIIAAIAAGVSLWPRNTGASDGLPGSEADISEIADFVLYLEVFDENDQLIGSASGFLVNDRSTLVTNYHVAQDARHIVASDAYGEQSVDVGSILAYDEIADLAILRCDSEAEVEPLALGDSETVRQGDKIYAVGYPLGLANTLSDGIVSSRYIDEYDNDILQVTAAISEGNSGGPLLDENGRVIGVMCAYYVYGQNLNIAIASNTLAGLLESGFHRVSLADWDNRPEMPGYEPEEEAPELGGEEPEEPAGEAPGAVEEAPGGESDADPKTEQPELRPPTTRRQEEEAQGSKPAAPAEPEDTGEAEDPSPWTPTFGPANPNWADTMKAKVDPRFHGTWDYYEVDNFEEQNEIIIDSVLEPPTCSIDLNCGVMSYLVGGSVNNRQNVNGTDQRNTLYKYYKSPYNPYMEETTLVLVSDGLIHATYVRYDTGDGGQTISRIAYYIFTKTSDLTYDDIPYM